MPGFSEAWLREYQAKRAAPIAVASPALIEFTLCRPTPLLNELIRMHWRARGIYQRSVSLEIARLVPDVPGRVPFARARVTVVRYSVQDPDIDGLIGGLKLMIDTLLVRSERHKDGLGFIVDDGPEHMTLDARPCRAAHRTEQKTIVRIERLA
jgi:hypothetical protein